MTFKPEAGLWSLLSGSLRRPRQWYWLAIAVWLLAQAGLLLVIGRRPPRPSSANTMRGIDFYPWKDLIGALVRSARIFRAENGYLPTLVSPDSFNEHIFARRFFAEIPMPSLADKLAAKDYAKARIGDEFLPVVAWAGDRVDGLFAAKVPAGRYVLKANHGCEWNLFLNVPEDLSAKRTEIEHQADTWLTSRYGYDYGEWQYSVFRPMLFLERFIDFGGNQTPDDYKFYCFRGKACLIEVDVDRFTELRSALYTPDWKYIPVNYGEAPVERARPKNLEDMVRIAEIVARDLDFARIDLYSDGKSKIKFGEITSFPGNGTLHFSNFKFDQWLGEHFRKMPTDIVPWN